MKILLVTQSSSLLGGVAVYLGHLVPMLAARGHVVQVATEAPDHQDSPDLMSERGMRLLTLKNAKSIQQILNDFEPDVIFCNQVANLDLEERIVSSGHAVLFVHTHHGTCVSGRKMHALPRPVPCARPLGPACLALYFPRRCGGLNPATAVRSYSVQRQRRQFLRRYQRLLVASQYMRQELIANGVDEERVVVAPLFAQFTPAEPCAIDDSRKRASLRLLFMGRLTDIKGGLTLTEALKRVRSSLDRPLELVVAGDGPNRAEMERRVAQWLPQTRFVGWVSEERKREILAACDLLVLPSTWPEPFGLVGIEAAAAGVPAVAFDVGGIREWLSEGQTGELAPGDPPTVEGLAKAILRAASDPDHLAYLGRQARAHSFRFTPLRHLETLELTLHQASLAGGGP